MVHRSIEGTPAEFSRVGLQVQRAGGPAETLEAPFPPASYNRDAMCTPPTGAGLGNERGIFSMGGTDVPGAADQKLPNDMDLQDLLKIYGLQSREQLVALFAQEA